MGNYDQHPGGGFSEVKGYVPPAGTMADEQRRRREDDQRRRAQAEADRRAAAMRDEEYRRQQADAERRAAVSRSNTRPPRRAAGRKAAPVRSSSPRSRSTPASPQQEQKDWNTPFAVIAFMVAGIWAAQSASGDDRWLPGLLAGAFAAYIAGRFYKAIITLGVIGLGLWIWASVNK